MKEKDLESKPWIEKYRPSSLEDIAASHASIVSTLSSFNVNLPHLLFYGPPGTGKTSTVLALARSLYGVSFKSQILELNASDDRGIDVVRNQIQSFASSKSFTQGQVSFKLIILDEADNMTTAAQNALRRVIEKYTKNVRFCLICNYVGKIIPAIQSRCTRFRFAPLSPIVVMDRIKMVMREENVVIDQDGLDAVVGLSKGDMRRALNILQAANASHNEITLDTIYQCTGNVHPNDVSHVFDLLLNSDFTECYNRILQLKTSRGIALVDLIQKIHELVMEIEFPDNVLIMLIDGLAVIEARLAVACDERIQLGALVGLFKMALELK